jgi:hypothetical protein
MDIGMAAIVLMPANVAAPPRQPNQEEMMFL